jgi:hypothetical protein
LNKGLAADGRYHPDKAKLLYSRNISSGWDFIVAFVFRYEGENVIALYSRGPEIFTVYDVIQPPFLHLELEDTEEYTTHLVRLEKVGQVKPRKYAEDDDYDEGFLRCEIVTNWKGTEKRSKHEIITLHYWWEEKWDPVSEYYADVIKLEYRTEFSKLSTNGKIDKNHTYDATQWNYVGETIENEKTRQNIYVYIFNYYLKKNEGSHG